MEGRLAINVMLYQVVIRVLKKKKKSTQKRRGSVCWRVGVATLQIVCCKDFIGSKTLKQRIGKQDMQVPGGTVFQVEGTAYAKALR